MKKESGLITKKDIGLSVKSVRKRAGKTQKWVAKKIKPKPIRPETISRIETGESNYRIDTLFQIAEVLEVDLSDLCKSNETKSGVKIYLIEEDNLDKLVEKLKKK